MIQTVFNININIIFNININCTLNIQYSFTDNKIVATSVTKRSKARDINDIRDKNEDPDQDKKLKQEPGVPQREQPQIVVPDSISELFSLYSKCSNSMNELLV